MKNLKKKSNSQLSLLRYPLSARTINKIQKQPISFVLGKRCSENMEQMYRGAPMSKCGINKVALQLC